MRLILACFAALFLSSCASVPPSYDESVVLLRSGDASCTGFVIDAEHRYVLTAAHCVTGPWLTVKMHDGQRYVADVVNASKDRDLALVQLPEHASGLVPTRFGDSSKVKSGDEVLAVGHPLGKLWTHSPGVVIEAENSVIQSVDTIKPGNSGGPLFNKDGEVVGVNVACVSIFIQHCVIGLSIPSRDALAVLQLFGVLK